MCFMAKTIATEARAASIMLGPVAKRVIFEAVGACSVRVLHALD